MGQEKKVNVCESHSSALEKGKKEALGTFLQTRVLERQGRFSPY